MKIGKRDRQILMLLPIVILGLYWQFWLKEARAERQCLGAGLRALGPVPQLRTRLEQLSADQGQLRRQLAELPPLSNTTAVAAQPPRSGRLRHLQELLQAHAVRLVSATALTQDDARKLRHATLETLAGNGVEGAQHWQIIAEADYPAMVRLLESCATGDNAPVVESLVLRAANTATGNPSYWKLILCL